MSEKASLRFGFHGQADTHSDGVDKSCSGVYPQLKDVSQVGIGPIESAGNAFRKSIAFIDDFAVKGVRQHHPRQAVVAGICDDDTVGHFRQHVVVFEDSS